MRRHRALGLGVLAGLSFIVGVVAGAGGSPGAASRAEERVLRAGVGSAPSTAVERARLREGAAIDRVLSYTSFISRGSPNKREVALTFDDGPGPFTPQVLAVLRRERTPATFFAIGEQAPDFGAALVEEVGAGYVVGDHTQTHPMMGDLSPRAQQREIEDQEILVEARGVPRQRLYRPPFGSYDRATLAILRRKRMLMILWDIDTEDYTRPGADAIARTALEGVRPGSIILMHDGGGDRSETVAALPQIIRGLRAKGLRPVTLPELLLDDPPPRTQGLPPSLSGG